MTVFSRDVDLNGQLKIARQGTAYFAQWLGALSDQKLEEESALPGWTRKHLVAHVGYNAAALCRLLDWAESGVPTPMYSSPEQRAREIAEGATLSATALRNLFDHTAARLDEKWRNLPSLAWDVQVQTAQGRLVPASETAWMRTREVWIHAVDLHNGGRFGDFPHVVLESLLTDIVGMWGRKELGGGLVLEVDARPPISVQINSEETARIRGSLEGIARWAAGRGPIGLTSGREFVPPRWL